MKLILSSNFLKYNIEILKNQRKEDDQIILNINNIDTNSKFECEKLSSNLYSLQLKRSKFIINCLSVHLFIYFLFSCMILN